MDTKQMHHPDLPGQTIDVSEWGVELFTEAGWLDGPSDKELPPEALLVEEVAPPLVEMRHPDLGEDATVQVSPDAVPIMEEAGWESAGAEQAPADGEGGDPSGTQPVPPTLYRHVGKAKFDAATWPDSGQVNAAGDPLYTFTGDTEPGDANGASDQWVVDTAAPAEQPETPPQGDTTTSEAATPGSDGGQPATPDTGAAPASGSTEEKGSA